MDPLPEDWDFLNYSIFDENPSSEFCLPNHSGGVETDLSSGAVALSQQEKDGAEIECSQSRKRGRNDSYSRPGSKACREKLRRERLNDRFLDLCSVLDPDRPVKIDKHAILDDAIRLANGFTSKKRYVPRGRNDSYSRPGSKACREKLRRERLNDRFLDLCSVLDPDRPVKIDKHAILDDAIRVLNQLRSESQELKETNEKLKEEIKSLKAEKHELREEKLMLKADKERMEQQLKAMAIPPAGFMPGHPAAYHAGPNKMPVFPSYGFVPMWQYMPPAARDTSHDHELRPPAA
nr:isoform 2 of transcription factor [Quercus suber]